MTIELFRKEEIIKMFVKVAKKALDNPCITEEDLKAITKAIEIAYAYGPISYIKILIEIKRMTKKIIKKNAEKT